MTTHRVCAVCRPAVFLLLVLLGCTSTGCRRSRTIMWDVPAVLPDHYRIFVDGRLVLTLPPPPVDRTCNCLKASFEVPRGKHIVRIDACNREGVCTPSIDKRTDQAGR